MAKAVPNYGGVPFASGMIIPGMGGGNPSGLPNLPGAPNGGAAPFTLDNMFNMFPANGIFTSGGTGGSGVPIGNIFNVGNTSSNNTKNELTNLFGTGFGNLTEQALSTGGFSPAIAQAFINQSMPLYGRGMESIANEFSGIGDRFSSAAAVGMGDFSSQFFNNLMGQIAGLDNQAINRSFGLLSQLLPNAQQETAQSNQNSWWKTILGAGANLLMPNAGNLLQGIMGKITGNGSNGGGSVPLPSGGWPGDVGF